MPYPPDYRHAHHPKTLKVGDTAGSIIFVASDGAPAEDNANLFWDDTNNRLGIGTASPGGLVDLTQSASGNQIRFATTGGSGAGRQWTFSAWNTPNSFSIDESGVDRRLTILPGGNVGIGTAAPDQPLDVRGEISIFGASASLARVRLRGFYAASPANPPTDQCDLIIVDNGVSPVFRVRYNDGGVMKVGDLALV